MAGQWSPKPLMEVRLLPPLPLAQINFRIYSGTMLTSQDLKQLRHLLREETQSESESLRTDLQGEIKFSRVKLEEKLNQITSRIKSLEQLSSKIQKDQKIITNYFDREYLQLRKDKDLVKNRLELPISAN